jgi:hypothetical protein
METQPNLKNTKNEILAAYEDLLKKVTDKKTDEPKKVQEAQKQEAVVKKAEGLSNETIIKGIAGLKVEITSALDKLGEKFVEEYKKFDELQQAIQTEKKNLEDLYQLSASTDSLSVMLLAQKEKKEQFEQEMAARKTEFDEKMKSEKERFDLEINEKKALWKKEQDTFQEKLKEENENITKKRKREEEEYQYALQLTRKKEVDLYEEKKLKLEKELADKKMAFEKEVTERETNLKLAETELKELRTKNAAFPAELERSVQSAVKSATEKVETTFNFQKELSEKEVSGELKLKEQIIQTLNAKIKDLEASLKELAQKTVTAEVSVKDIAMKAIEHSSKPYYIEKQKESGGKE